MKIMKSNSILGLETLHERQRENLVLLTDTRAITDEDLERHEIFKELKYIIYGKFENHVKITAAIFKSIIYQRKVVFTITRESLRELVKRDPDLVKQNIGLSNDMYSLIVGDITLDYVQCIQKADKFKQVYLYQVTHPDLLELIGLPAEEICKQRKKAILFQKKIRKEKEDETNKNAS